MCMMMNDDDDDDDDDDMYHLLSDKNLFIFASNNYMFLLHCHSQAITSNM
jgi:hypothetical protein